MKNGLSRRKDRFKNEYELYPFNPEVLIPSTKYFWKNMKMIKIGTSDKVAMANMAPQSDCEDGSENILSAREIGYLVGLFK